MGKLVVHLCTDCKHARTARWIDPCKRCVSLSTEPGEYRDMDNFEPLGG